MNDKAIDRPFDKDIMDKAIELAKSYTTQIHPDVTDGFWGTCVEIPGVMFDGDTLEECEEAGREAIQGVLASMIEEGVDIISKDSKGGEYV